MRERNTMPNAVKPTYEELELANAQLRNDADRSINIVLRIAQLTGYENKPLEPADYAIEGEQSKLAVHVRALMEELRARRLKQPKF